MLQIQWRRGGRAACLAVLGASAVLVGGAMSGAAASGSTGSANCSASWVGVTHVGHASGFVRPAGAPSSSCSGPTAKDPNSGDGTPPLINHGGPMMSTRSNSDRVVVTAIYWAPSGYSFVAKYKNVINQYLADAAHDSDLSTNVFSTLYEYSGSNGFINYRMQRGTPIIDTNAYPAAGCTTDPGPVYSDNSGYSTCIDDAQEQAQINSVVSAHSLPRDLGHIYVLFLPKHVESCFFAGNPSDQECTLNATTSAAYCAYHSEITSNTTVYANMPFPVYASTLPYTCGSDAAFPTEESPNAAPDADTEISPLSHEMSEAITDPDTNTGWYDSSGYENGDECAYKYGATAGAAGGLYNQTINGRHYITQEEFSNNNYNLGQGGCLQHYVPAAKPAITAMSSHAGTTAGGQKVTITGTTLGGATVVDFGTTPATFTVVDPTHLTVTTPAHAAGAVAVRVKNSLGFSAIVTADNYTYS